MAGLTSESQVSAMISLLSDSNEQVVRRCHRALLEAPRVAEPLLRERLEGAVPEERAGLLRVLVDVVGARYEKRIVEHLAGPVSLEEGSVLIGRLVDPGEAPDAAAPALDALSEQLLLRLDGQRGAEAEVSAMLDVLVRQAGLRGALPTATRPEHASLHGALQRRQGLPLPLSIAWILVARRAGLMVEGLGMPAHFLVRHRHAEGLRILDPFHGGRAVEPVQCRRHLAAAGHPHTDLDALVACDREMLLRTLRNLVVIGHRLGRPELVARCGRILVRAG